jgi:hypothetical protein
VNRRHTRKGISPAKAVQGGPDAHEEKRYNACGQEKGPETKLEEDQISSFLFHGVLLVQVFNLRERVLKGC